ncbi:MAG: ISKra4 family transposase [Hormoscilla sp. GUM202]|nr:ISKra4 family transposase [Hormoscilla sp. GUM202]
MADGEPSQSGRKRQVKTGVGTVTVNSKQAKKLGLKKGTQISPVISKCCWVLSANESYQQAEKDLELLTGIKVGHSSIHRLVQRSEFPEAQSSHPVTALSVSGGKVRLRTEGKGSCEWRDYKAVSLHGEVCGAYFQDNAALVEWVKQQPLTAIITCLGDGHDGIWNIIAQLRPENGRREVLDWYDLVENIYKIGDYKKRLRQVKSSLWHGFIDEALELLASCHGQKVQNFRAYLTKHCHRIVNYDLYQFLGIPIGSGEVESVVKRIGSRLKLSGAQWLPTSVNQMLRLRCAYLNGALSLSTIT